MANAARKRVRGPRQYTEDWYNLRIYDPEREDAPKVVIGASEAAAACNVSEWRDALDVFRVKRGYVEPWEPAPGDLRAEIGRRIEPVTLDFAEELLPKVFEELQEFADPETGRIKIRRNIPMYWLTDPDCISASPDGMIVGAKQSVDAKATFSPRQMAKWGDEGTDDIPDDYILQAQQQMLVMGCDRVYFPVLFGSGAIRCYRVTRSDSLIKGILKSESELAEMIRDDVPPDPNWNLPRTLEMVKSMYDLTEGYEIELSEEGVRSFWQWQTLNEIEKTISQQKKAAQAKLLMEMGEAELARVPGSEKEVVRYAVAGKLWSEQDLDDVREKLKSGAYKTKPYTRLGVRKCKSRK